MCDSGRDGDVCCIGAAGGGTIRFRSGKDAVPAALKQAGAWLAQLGMSPDLIEDGTIALAEVLNNIEEHAYARREPGPVIVRIARRTDVFDCAVADRGAPFPGGRPPQTTMPGIDPVAPAALPEGGFGWPMVRHLATELRYRRTGSWNRLRFTVTARPATRSERQAE